jgi:hypothetical protein
MNNDEIELISLHEKRTVELPFYFYCYRLLSQKYTTEFTPISEIRLFLGRNLKLRRGEARQLLLMMRKKGLILIKNRGVLLL